MSIRQNGPVSSAAFRILAALAYVWACVREQLLNAAWAVRTWRPFRCRACRQKRVYLPATCPRCVRLARQVWGYLHMEAAVHVRPARNVYGFQVYRTAGDLMVKLSADTSRLATQLQAAAASMPSAAAAIQRFGEAYRRQEDEALRARKVRDLEAQLEPRCVVCGRSKVGREMLEVCADCSKLPEQEIRRAVSRARGLPCASCHAPAYCEQETVCQQRATGHL